MLQCSHGFRRRPQRFRPWVAIKSAGSPPGSVDWRCIGEPPLSFPANPGSLQSSAPAAPNFVQIRAVSAEFGRHKNNPDSRLLWGDRPPIHLRRWVGSSSGSLWDVDYEGCPLRARSSIRRIVARSRALSARIWTMLRFSGAGFGRGDFRGTDAIRRIMSGPRRSSQVGPGCHQSSREPRS